MQLMFFGILGVYQDIINKNYDELIQIWSKDSVHKIHEYGGGIS